MSAKQANPETPRSWYPVENGKFVIQIQVESLKNLFDERDPNPFRQKDIDDDAEEYLVSSVEEVSLKRVGKFRILCQAPFTETEAREVQDALRDFFIYRAELMEKRKTAIFRLGRKTLMIGGTFLIIGTGFSLLPQTLFNNEWLSAFSKEGLHLLGWVSMWKPISIFLYEWWPLADRRDLYLGMSKLPIELKTT